MWILLLSLLLALSHIGSYAQTPEERKELLDLFMDRLMTKPKDIPLYPYSFTLAHDGPLEAIVDPDLFEMANRLSGRGKNEALFQASNAIKFVQDQYGFDFSDAPEDVLLGRQNMTKYEGNVTFTSYVFSPKSLFRLITATDRKSASKYNNYVTNFGWMIIVNAEMQANGTVNITMPSGSIGTHGSYAIRVGETADERFRTKYSTPFPGPILLMNYQSRLFTPPPDPLTNYFVTDAIVEHDILGTGSVRGLYIPRPNDNETTANETVWSGREVITFPADLKFELFSDGGDENDASVNDVDNNENEI